MLPILHNDDRIVILDKPAGVAVAPGRGEHDSAIHLIAEQLKLPVTGSEDPRIRLVHRLDKDTSGVFLLAKDVEAQRHLSHQFQNNKVRKEYLALVAGRPPADGGTIDGNIGIDPNNSKKMAVVRHGGRPAITDWQVEARYRNYTLIRCFPKTGKTHQIRVHLKSIGLPLAIDPLYSPRPSTEPQGLLLSTFKRGYRPKRNEPEQPLIDRLTLHAHALTFQHPNGQEMRIEAPIPKDLRSALNQLNKHGS